MNYKIKINDAEYEIHIQNVEDTKAYVTVNDEEFEVDIEGLATDPTQMNIQTPSKSISKPLPTNNQKVKPVKTNISYDVKPPLPGVIMDICVKEGDQIKKGQVLYVLEAMKMENHIESDYDGIVEKIYYTKGTSVLENDVILNIT